MSTKCVKIKDKVWCWSCDEGQNICFISNETIKYRDLRIILIQINI